MKELPELKRIGWMPWCVHPDCDGAFDIGPWPGCVKRTKREIKKILGPIAGDARFVLVAVYAEKPAPTPDDREAKRRHLRAMLKKQGGEP